MKKPTIQEKNCSICDIPIEENYCGRCGQEYTGKPTSILLLITDFFSNFLSLEKSGFATIFKILKNPKPIVENYCLGYRNYYASPGKVLLYGLAVVALHLSFIYYNNHIIDSNNILGISLNIENVNVNYFFWSFIFLFLLIPSYLTFAYKERNLSKHLISIVYIATSIFIVLIILNDLYTILSQNKPTPLSFLAFILLVFYWNSRVFTKKRKFMFIVLNTIIQTIIFIGIMGVFFLYTQKITNS